MDDYKSMTIIANLLHHQDSAIPDEVSLHQLYQLAGLVNKYDLQRGLGRWPHHWCNKQQTHLVFPSSEKWLRISAVFDQPSRLEGIARHLVTTSTLSQDGNLLTADGVDVQKYALPDVYGSSFTKFIPS